jgi:hypothetical protein
VLPESRDIYAQRPTLRAWHEAIAVLPRNARRPRASKEGADAAPNRATTESPEAEPDGNPSLPPEVEHQLRSLGYLD